MSKEKTEEKANLEVSKTRCDHPPNSRYAKAVQKPGAERRATKGLQEWLCGTYGPGVGPWGGVDEINLALWPRGSGTCVGSGGASVVVTDRPEGRRSRPESPRRPCVPTLAEGPRRRGVQPNLTLGPNGDRKADG